MSIPDLLLRCVQLFRVQQVQLVSPERIQVADGGDLTARISMFTAYLEDLGRIGVRHENTRGFYLSVISALFVFLALANSDGLFRGIQHSIVWVVAAVGILTSIMWIIHMGSFARIYVAKRGVLMDLEKRLPAQPLKQEATILEQIGYTHITTVDRLFAVIFVILFGVLAAFKFTPCP
jgi:hypothetical protein